MYPGANKCSAGNWYGWTNFKPEGSISTTLKGNGRARLFFGNCWDGRKPWDKGYVKAYLDGSQMKYASHGKHVSHMFNYKNGSKLEIREINGGIIQFNKFQTLASGTYLISL